MSTYPRLGFLASRSLRAAPASIKSIHTELKFCFNCKFCLPNKRYETRSEQLEFARCSENPTPDSTYDYLVAGERKFTDYEYCSRSRERGKCGPKGIMYVAKDEQDLKK